MICGGEVEREHVTNITPDWRHELRAHFSLEHGACYWIGNIKVSKEQWDAAMEMRSRATGEKL